MKFSDITDQDMSTLTEAPMGFMNTLKTGAKALLNPSLSGRKQAQGQFKTGVGANQIYAQYYNWLGQTGNPADTDTVLAFLQQNGYGPAAVTAAQDKFPKVNNAPANPTTAAPAAAPPANDTTKQDNLKARLKSGQGMGTKTGSGFKTSQVGAPRQRTYAKKDGAPGSYTVRESRGNFREAVALNKQQLSAIFTAVVQSGATPQVVSNSTTGGGNATVNMGDQNQSQSSGATNQQASNQSQSSNATNQQASNTRLPSRLTAEQMLQYYANLDKPGQDQVKKGIAEIDKQLTVQAQQARQQPAK
jgi:hypothetical protein